MAVSYLYDTLGENMWDMEGFLLQTTDRKKSEILVEMIRKNINTPLTSSIGRLFDAVSAITGIRHQVSFEGQAAMELELMADLNDEIPAYDFEWTGGDPKIIQTRPMIRGIIDDLKKGMGKAEISSRFHATLIRLFSDLCQDIRKQTDIDQVVLSGGVFQNAILLTGLVGGLEKKGFRVFSHSIVPTNDGGISLGQAVAAAAIVNTL